MPKVSIIIPVYNAEKHIERCLESIKCQEYKDMEIILINDGSKDDSEKVIKNYIKNNLEGYNVSYYTKKNEGVAKTRNYGIKKAKGEYIFFVDSDDYISKETMEVLEPYIRRDFDLIKFKLQRVNENNNIIERVDGPVFDEKTGAEAFNLLYSQDVLLDSPCVYLIKKELFTKNKYEFQGTYHEDFGLIPLIILQAKKVVSLPDYLYQYVQAQNSITRNDDYKKTLKKMDDVFFHYDRMLKEISKMNLDKITDENVKIYYTNAIILKLKELNSEDREKYINEIKKRNMLKNIKVRNIKQLVKKILLNVNVNWYLKMR